MPFFKFYGSCGEDFSKINIFLAMSGDLCVTASSVMAENDIIFYFA